MTLLAVLLVALGACSEVDQTAGDGAGLDTWCALETDEISVDPADPASVQRGFEANLRFAQERADLAPEEIAEQAEIILNDMEQRRADLEAAGWDPAQVDDAVPADVASARAAVDEFVAETCP